VAGPKLFDGGTPGGSLRANYPLRLAQQVRDEGVSIDEPKGCSAFEEEFGFDVRPHTDVAG
jgi:hypothetical protein